MTLADLKPGEDVAWSGSDKSHFHRMTFLRNRGHGGCIGAGDWDYSKIIPWTERHDELLASQDKARRLTSAVYTVRDIDRKLERVPEENRERAAELFHELAALIPEKPIT